MMRLELRSFGVRNLFGKIGTGYKLAAIVILNALVFGAFFFLVLGAQFETRSRLAEEYATLKKDLAKVTAIKNNMEKYRAEYARTREKLKEVLVQLPERKDIPNLLRNISGIGTESGIKIKYFEPKTLVNKEFYGELPFEIKFAGSFYNIGYFFDGIRKLDRVIDITSFTIDAKGPLAKMVLEGQCQAKTFIYIQGAPAEKKESKGGSPVKK
jgi:type IV pilus assembly protein PilO